MHDVVRHRDAISTIKHAVKSLSFVSDAVVVPAQGSKQPEYSVYASMNELSVDHKIAGNVVEKEKLRNRFKTERRNIRKVNPAKAKKLGDASQEQLLQQAMQRRSFRDFQGVRRLDMACLAQWILASGDIGNSNIQAASANRYQVLNACLRVLQGIKVESSYCYKYLYPSAGALYPVRTYLASFHPEMGVRDVSYYHPHQHNMYSVSTLGEGERYGGQLILIATAALQAIKPMYGDISQKYCEIEHGHMLAKMQQVARGSGYQFSEIDISDFAEQPWLEQDEIVLAAYTLDLSGQQRDLRENYQLYVYRNDDDNGCLYKWYQNQLLPVDAAYDYPVCYDHQGDNAKIVHAAQCLVLFAGGSSQKNHINAGIQAQHLIEMASKHQFGFCPIGITPMSECFATAIGQPIIYALAGGSVSSEQLESQDMSLPTGENPPLEQYIKTYLSGQVQQGDCVSNVTVYW